MCSTKKKTLKVSEVQSNNSEERVASDKGHEHFVTTLEQTFDILRPYMSCSSTKSWLATQLECPSGDSIESLGLENRFSALEIEEPSLAFEAHLRAPNIYLLVKQEMAQGARYDAESDTSLQEQILAVHLFWQDVCHIRRLCELMMIPDPGEDYSARAVTINTAITCVRDIEKDFEKQIPDQVDYAQKASRFYTFNCDVHGHD